jgi:hypothetical protein
MLIKLRKNCNTQATSPTRNPAQWLTSFAWPTLVGMAVFAFGSSFTAYLGVKLFLRLNVNLKRWRRRLSH